MPFHAGFSWKLTHGTTMRLYEQTANESLSCPPQWETNVENLCAINIVRAMPARISFIVLENTSVKSTS
jgi:hypothetical protein